MGRCRMGRLSFMQLLGLAARVWIEFYKVDRILFTSELATWHDGIALLCIDRKGACASQAPISSASSSHKRRPCHARNINRTSRYQPPAGLAATLTLPRFHLSRDRI